MRSSVCITVYSCKCCWVNSWENRECTHDTGKEEGLHISSWLAGSFHNICCYIIRDSSSTYIGYIYTRSHIARVYIKYGNMMPGKMFEEMKHCLTICLMNIRLILISTNGAGHTRERERVNRIRSGWKPFTSFPQGLVVTVLSFSQTILLPKLHEIIDWEVSKYIRNSIDCPKLNFKKVRPGNKSWKSTSWIGFNDCLFNICASESLAFIGSHKREQQLRDERIIIHKAFICLHV